MKHKFRGLFSFVSFILLTALLSNAQERIRTVEKGVQYPNCPIEIVDRALGDKPFIDDTRASGDKDWLKTITFVVKNVSTKNILSFDIDLLVKKKEKILLGIPVNFRTYNESTAHNALTLDGKKKIGVLRPGEVVKVKISERAMSVFGNELEKSGIEDLDRVTIDVRFIYFDDGTRWILGQEGAYDEKTRLRSTKLQVPSRHQFDEFRRTLYPPETGCAPTTLLAFIYPASSRIFLRFSSASTSSPQPPPACVWLVNSELLQEGCSFATTCVDLDRLCVFDDFEGAVRSEDPGGAVKGYLNYEPDLCERGAITPEEANCVTCQPFNQNIFRADPQCGQPGTCGQPATWGCVAGLTDVNGVCQKSLQYQEQCGAAGYNALSCSCNPPTCVPETCDGLDNNCNGLVDETFDLDGDGYTSCNGDCVDDDPFTYPGAPTQPGCWWNKDSDCDGITDDMECVHSPIVVDVEGDGFDLTNAANGVDFDLTSDGVSERLSWTSARSDDALLALDRNSNGRIDNG